MYLMRVVPVSQTQVSMQYEVYRNKSSSDETFQSLDKFFKQIEGEDKFLCTNAQKNLNAGGYVSGPLHEQREKGVLHFKSLVKGLLVEHREKEKAQGHQITPAKRGAVNSEVEEEEQFCKDLCASSHEGLAW